MDKLDLLLLQTQAEFEKITEIEGQKEYAAKVENNLPLAFYHKGRRDGIELLRERITHLQKIKNERSS